MKIYTGEQLNVILGREAYKVGESFVWNGWNTPISVPFTTVSGLREMRYFAGILFVETDAERVSYLGRINKELVVDGKLIKVIPANFLTEKFLLALPRDCTSKKGNVPILYKLIRNLKISSFMTPATWKRLICETPRKLLLEILSFIEHQVKFWEIMAEENIETFLSLACHAIPFDVLGEMIAEKILSGAIPTDHHHIKTLIEGRAITGPQYLNIVSKDPETLLPYAAALVHNRAVITNLALQYPQVCKFIPDFVFDGEASYVLIKTHARQIAYYGKNLTITPKVIARYLEDMLYRFLPLEGIITSRYNGMTIEKIQHHIKTERIFRDMVNKRSPVIYQLLAFDHGANPKNLDMGAVLRHKNKGDEDSKAPVNNDKTEVGKDTEPLKHLATCGACGAEIYGKKDPKAPVDTDKSDKFLATCGACGTKIYKKEDPKAPVDTDKTEVSKATELFKYLVACGAKTYKEDLKAAVDNAQTNKEYIEAHQQLMSSTDWLMKIFANFAKVTEKETFDKVHETMQMYISASRDAKKATNPEVREYYAKLLTELEQILENTLMPSSE